MTELITQGNVIGQIQNKLQVMWYLKKKVEELPWNSGIEQKELWVSD